MLKTHKPSSFSNSFFRCTSVLLKKKKQKQTTNHFFGSAVAAGGTGGVVGITFGWKAGAEAESFGVAGELAGASGGGASFLDALYSCTSGWLKAFPMGLLKSLSIAYIREAFRWFWSFWLSDWLNAKCWFSESSLLLFLVTRPPALVVHKLQAGGVRALGLSLASLCYNNETSISFSLERRESVSWRKACSPKIHIHILDYNALVRADPQSNEFVYVAAS